MKLYTLVDVVSR